MHFAERKKERKRKSEFLIKEIVFEFLFDIKRNANFLDKHVSSISFNYLSLNIFAFFHFQMQLHAMRPQGICISNPICKMELKMLQEFFIYVMRDSKRHEKHEIAWETRNDSRRRAK